MERDYFLNKLNLGGIFVIVKKNIFLSIKNLVDVTRIFKQLHSIKEK